MALPRSLLRRSLILGVQRIRGDTPILSLYSLQYRRLVAGGIRSAGKKKEKRSHISRRRHDQEKLQKQKEALNAKSDAAGTSAEAASHDDATSPFWQRFVVPVRYRVTGSHYTREQFVAMAQRLPLWIALCALLLWEETTPFTLLKISGPSMIPTMAPDGSEVWLRSTGKWRLKSLDSYYRRGDLVGFAHPDTSQRVSCKRIIGVAGDRVNRYGQFVKLYVDQDPTNLGQIWPDEKDPNYQWIDRSFAWDNKGERREPTRTIVVPDGHVWLEADCPGLGIDSRQFGPVPLEWLRGKVVWQLWPLWKQTKNEPRFAHVNRPHPIPLDEATLRKFNVHAIPSKN